MVFPDVLAFRSMKVLCTVFRVKRVIKDGDIVSLDIGIIYEGYYSDMAVTVPIGRYFA